MGKKQSSDELNCGSCGYNTCREKAIAIYQGKAEVSMCLPYLKEKAMNFSDSVINNIPLGILVLNEKLEVQNINNAALRIMNMRRAEDIMGCNVVRILEPGDFASVLETERSIRSKPCYLAEYGRHVEETIITTGNIVLFCAFCAMLPRRKPCAVKKTKQGGKPLKLPIRLLTSKCASFRK